MDGPQRPRPSIALSIGMVAMGLHRAIIVGLALFVTTAGYAQAPREGSGTSGRPAYYLELPTLDASSRGTSGYPVPSAQQSLWVTADSYQLVNHYLSRWTGFDEKTGFAALLPGTAIVGANAVMLILPPGMEWQHEQWHKVVLSMHHIDSKANANNVSNVSDASLAALKREHPADFVRLHTAAIEGGYEVATALEKTQFFRRTTSWNVATLWSLYAGNSLYMHICASAMSGNELDYFAAQANPLERDIVGADCTGWTYELFRPNEPYSARGPHPSGIGIRRYRTYAELPDDERRYLRTQRAMSFLNFLDPALWGIRELYLGPLRLNGHVRHMPTSFGHAISLDGFFSMGRLDWFLSIQNYFNQAHWYPGIVAELWRYPVPTRLGPQLLISVRAGAWLQPKDQLFATSSAQPGAMGALRFGLFGSHGLEPYVELESKTAGWVAGILTQDPVASVRMGIGYTAF